MQSYLSDSDDYQTNFTQWLKGQEREVVTWFTGQEKRLVSQAVLKNHENSLVVRLADSFEHLESNSVVYFFSETNKIIFRTEVVALDEQKATVKMPASISLLSYQDFIKLSRSVGQVTKDYLKKMSFGQIVDRSESDQSILDTQLEEMSVDEEDKIYADQRESPRARPKVKKKINLSPEEYPDLRLDFALFDLSRGGLSFVVDNPEKFSKGDIISIHKFDDKDLDQPLLGEVASLRAIDDEQGHKIGVKFLSEI